MFDSLLHYLYKPYSILENWSDKTQHLLIALHFVPYDWIKIQKYMVKTII